MRKRAALSQVQLAQRLAALGQSFVSKIERGEAYVELPLFIDWCLACGAKPGAALGCTAGATARAGRSSAQIASSAITRFMALRAVFRRARQRRFQSPCKAPGIAY
jgi:hypothetical protein